MFPEPLRFKRHCASGVTLIELLIVVAAISILAAVALPSYQSSVRKAHRTDAKTALTKGAQSMERYFTENSQYVGAEVGKTVDAKSENGYYTISLNPAPASSPPTFTLRATPQGAQAADGCGAFTINEQGEPNVDGTLSLKECW